MRTFVAIDITEPIRRQIVHLIELLKPATTRVRWTREEGLHITLKFIGHIPSEKVEEVKECLASIRMPAPLSLQLRGSGYFPSERSPRVIWLGVEAGPELAQLAVAVEESLLKLGIPKENRPFSAHLTLGRLRMPDRIVAVKELLHKRAPLELGSFTASELYLYESKLSSEGSVYRKIARFPLTGGSP